MTYRVGDDVVVEREPDGVCAACNVVAEVRPYGPGGTLICFPCGKQDPEGTARRMLLALYGPQDTTRS